MFVPARELLKLDTTNSVFHPKDAEVVSTEIIEINKDGRFEKS